MIARIPKNVLAPELVTVLLYGFSSGLPFLLILSTLSVWLAELGVSKTTIGLVAWTSVPYTLKFVWGVMVDNYQVPLLTRYFGPRRAWILLAQVCLWLSLVLLGMSDPLHNFQRTAFLALLVGFFSALQDVVIDAYRIESLTRAQAGLGVTLSTLGYRMGMLVSGAGAVFFAEYFNSWSRAYSLCASCMALGLLTTLWCREPSVHREAGRFMVMKSLKSFVRHLDWHIIVPFILSYKIVDTVLNAMSMPFLLELGFSKLEIAYVAKTFGITAMVAGGFVGGILLTRQNVQQNLLLCVLLQLLASLLFIVQFYVGHDVYFLFVAMGVENFTCGLSQVGLIAYLSELCRGRNTAMYYAILTSFASFVRVGFSAVAGWLADRLAWPQFYGLVFVSCWPSVWLLVQARQHFVRYIDDLVLLPSAKMREDIEGGGV